MHRSMIAALILALTPITAEAEDWSGVYVGASVGGAWSDLDLTRDLPDLYNFSTNNSPSGFYRDDLNISDSGIIGGLHIGVQKQLGQMVIGIEGTASYGTLGGDDDSFKPNIDQRATVDLDVNGIYTLTGKLGVAVTSRLMAYAKAGLAVVRTDISEQSDNINNPSPSNPPRYIDARSKGNDYGWTVGVGADYKLTNRILIGINYDYISVDIDDRSADLSNGFDPGRRTFTDIDFDVHAVTARLSYLFGSQHIPLK
ncbi:MAG: outer membrane protein [Bythopirellula sp.]